MKDIKNLFIKKETEEFDKEYEIKLRNHKIKKFGRMGIALIVVLVLIIGIKIYYNGKEYTSYSVTDNILSGDTTKCQFYEFGDSFLRYSNDGLAYIKDGESVWNQAFEMKQPVIDTCENYVAITEKGSNAVYIYNKEGSQGKITTSYPIVDIEVAAQGVVAAITEENEANHIEVIDKDGNILVMGQTVLSGDGCPLDISLSNDGTKLIVSYLYMNGGVTQTKVVFYNYSEVGKNEVDRIVGGFNQYKTTIVPKVEFVTNDIAVAFGDNMFTIYSIKQKPSILMEEEFDKEIKSILYNDEYIGFVFESQELDGTSAIWIYDLSGDRIYESELSMKYKNIKLDGDNILIYDENNLIVQTVTGKLKFEGEFENGINEVIGLNGKNKYILVSSESIDEIKLK
ncbi:MAG: hypothetical protein GX225_08250 [Clostridiales bacterium]|nr:hypothetical protein [Clostridiales bacterium]